MRQKLINILKIIASDVRQAAIPASLVLFFGGSAGILLFSKKALDFSIYLATTPTPLWATIVVVLLFCLYTYINTHNILKKHYKLNQSSCAPKDNIEKIELTFKNNLLWMENDKSPFCPVCYEVSEKPIHLLLHHGSNDYEEFEYYECHNCEYRTEPKTIASF